MRAHFTFLSHASAFLYHLFITVSCLINIDLNPDNEVNQQTQEEAVVPTTAANMCLWQLLRPQSIWPSCAAMYQISETRVDPKSVSQLGSSNCRHSPLCNELATGLFYASTTTVDHKSKGSCRGLSCGATPHRA